MLRFNFVNQIVIALCFAVSFAAKAQTEPPQFMTVDGRLYDSTTPEDPLLDNSVLMKIQVLNPAKTCILYEEEQTVSTLSSNGYFNVRVGSPTSGAESLKRTTNDSGNSMMAVFQNQNASITGRTSGGGGCSYTPAAGDTRYFRYIVTPSTTGVTSTLSPDMQIDSVPQALVAETLQGMSPDDFVQINSDVTQAKANSLFGGSYTTLTGLLAGTSSLYLRNTTNGTVIPSRATDPLTPSAGQIWYDSDDNVLRYYDGTVVQTLSSGSADPTKLPLAGGTMAGAIDMATNDITDIGHMTQAPQRTFRFGVYTTAQQTSLIATPLIAGHEGTVWYNTTTNKLMFWDGTAEYAVSPVDSVFGRTGAVVAVAGDYTATQITNTAAGNIAATDAQAAINELDTEKVAKSGDTMTGSLNIDNEQELRLSEADGSGANYVAIKSPTTLSADYTLTLPATDGDSGQVLTTDGSGVLSWTSLAAVGETNTASNQGAGGVGLYDAKSGVDLQFRNINAASNKISVALDAGNKEVDLNVNEANLDTSVIPNTAAGTISATNTQAAINELDTEKVATTRAINTAAGSGLSGGGDLSADRSLSVNINGMTAETAVAGADEILIYDASASALRKMTRTNFVLSETEVDAMVSNNGYLTSEADTLATVTGRGASTATNITMNTQAQTRYADSAGGEYAAIQAPATIASNYVLTLPTTDGDSGQVLTTDGSGVLTWTSLAAVGETNTASNQGAGGVGLYDAKSGVDLQFRNINAANNKISVALDAGNKEVDINVNEANLSTASIPNTAAGSIAATNTQAAINELDTEKVAKSGDTMTGSLNLDNEQELRLSEADGSGANYVAIKALTTLGANYTLTLPPDDGNSGQYLQTDGNGVLTWVTPAGVGETNTASNQGAGGVGVFKQKTTYDLEFRNINAASNKISVALDAGNNEIDINVAEANLDTSVIPNTAAGTISATNTQAAINELDTEKVAKSGDTMTGRLNMGPSGAASGDGGSVVFTELASNGSSQVGFRAPDDVTTGVIWSLPSSDGAAGQVLQTNGSSVLGWVSAPTNGGTFLAGDGTAANPSMSFINDSNTGIYSYGADQIGFSTGGTARLLLNNNYMSSSTTGSYYLRNSGVTSANPAFTFVGDSDTGLFGAAANVLGLSTGGVERLRVDSLGYVGIGTTAPSTVLDVAGSITSRPYGTAAGETGQLSLRELAANGTNTATVRSPDILAANYVLTLPVDDGSAGQYLQTDGNGVLSWVTPAGVGETNTASNQGVGGVGVFDAKATFDLQFRNINAASNKISVALDAGNKEIDINVNEANLDSGIIPNTAAGNIAATNTQAAINELDTEKVAKAGDTMTGLLTMGARGVASGDGGAISMRELAAGGTNTAMIRAPDALTADYILTLPGDDGSSGQVLTTDGSGVLNWTTISTTIADDSLNFDKFSDTMSLDASTDIAASGTNVLSITNSGTGNSFVVNDQTSDTTPFVIDASGNVGIGTTVPGEALQVFRTGNVNVATISGSNNSTNASTINATFAIENTDATANNYTLMTFQQDGNGMARMGSRNLSSSDGDFVFQVRNSNSLIDAIYIRSTGSVGIGTTSPGTSLDVAGAITSRPNGTGTGQTGQLVLRELAAGGTNTATIRAPDALASDYALTLPTSAGSSGQVLQTNGSGVLSWATALTGSTGFINGGNSFGAAATLGTNDNYALQLEANNSTAMTINPDGSVGVGNAGSNVRFSVQGGLRIDEGDQSNGGGSLWQYGLTFGAGSGEGITSKRGAGGNQYGLDFFTGGGDIRMSLTSGGSLGVGTTAPGTLLDVAGAITSRPNGAGTGQTGQLILRELAAGGTNTATIRAPDALAADYALTLPSSAGSANQVLTTDGAGILSWTTPSTASVTADSLNFTDFADAMTLDASTDISVTGSDILSITNSGTGSSFRVNDEASDTTPFVVDAAGLVGIGTTTPSVALDVVTTGSTTVRAEASGANNSMFRADTFGAGTPYFTGYDANGVVGAPTVTTSGNGLGIFSAMGHNGTGYATDVTGVGNAGIAIVADGNFSGTSYPASLRFYTTPTGSQTSVNRVTFSSNGGVGIGTTAPGALLHINGMGNETQGVMFGSGTAAFGERISGELATYFSGTARHQINSGAIFSGASHGYRVSNSGTVTFAPSGSDTDSGLGTISDNVIALYTANTNRVNINATGLVGIGTTSPGTILDAAGAITSRPFGTATGETGQLILRELAAGGTNTATIRAPDALAADYALTLPDSAGSSGQLLQTNGSGVLSWVSAPVTGGTVAAGAGSSATPALSFSGDANTGFYNPYGDAIGIAVNGNNIFTFDSNGMYAGSGIYIRPSGATSAVNPVYTFEGDDNTGMFRPAADVVGFSTAGTERMRISSTGSVGIGTTAPSTNLHVLSAGGSSSVGALLVSDSADSDYVHLDPNFGLTFNRSPAYINNNFVGGSLILRTSNSTALDTSAMTITGSGSVGIGTTNPGFPLEVNGAIVSKSTMPHLGLFDSDATADTGRWLLSSSTANTFRIQAVTDVGAGGGSVVDITRSGNNVSAFQVGTVATPAFKVDTVSGNVGIGSTAPQHKLDVWGSGDYTARIMRSDSDNTAYSPLMVARKRADATAPGANFGAAISYMLEGFTNDDLVRTATITSRWDANQTNDTTARDAHLIFATLLDNTLNEAMRITSAGNVGINIGAPTQTLEVGGSGLITANMYVGSDANTNPASNNTVGVVAGSGGFISTNRTGGGSAFFGRQEDGVIVQFYSAGTAEGSISLAGTTVSYNAFTGSHFALTDEKVARGELVSMDGEPTYKYVESGEPYYNVKISKQKNAKNILGAMLDRLEPTQKVSLENPYQVMAVGNGDMWVIDKGEDVQVGDYLIASDVPGHAEKDIGEFEVAHVVARVAENIRWKNVSKKINGVKHKKISVTFEQFDRFHAKKKFEVQERAIASLKTAGDKNAETIKKLQEENKKKTQQIEMMKAYLCSKDPKAPFCN